MRFKRAEDTEKCMCPLNQIMLLTKNIVHILILLQGLCLKYRVLLNSGLYMDDIAV